jgi:hypothetical protein
MAYSLLQQDMLYFDLPGIGFLGYRMRGNTAFVLGNVQNCARREDRC